MGENICRNEIIYKFEKEDSLSVTDFLSSEIQFRQLRLLDQKLNDYIALKAEELLKYAISEKPEDASFGAKAFILLSRPAPQVSHALIDTDIFIQKCANSIYTGHNQIIISRIATIFLGILYTSTKITESSLPFLSTLTGMVDNLGVCDLFATIVKSSFPKPEIQQQLIDLHVGMCFLTQLDSELTDDKGKNIFNILRNAAKNPILATFFHSDACIDRVLAFFKECPPKANYAPQMYQFLAAVCVEDTVDKLIPTLDICSRIILSETKPINLFVPIIDYTAKMIALRPTCVKDFGAHIILQTCFSFIYLNEDNVNLLGAVFRLITSSLKVKELLPIIISDMIPGMMEKSKESAFSAAKGKCLLFINDLAIERHMNHPLDKELRKVTGLLEFCKTFLKEKIDKMQDPYGGETLPEQKLPPLLRIPNNTGLDFGPLSPMAH